MLSVLILAIFPLLMVFAAVSDLLTMTIPNMVSVILVAGFALFALYIGAPMEMVMSHVLCAVAMLALAFGMFVAGWIGGGDAKLFAAIALWLGWERLPEYGVWVALLGGALTLVIVLIRFYDLPEFVLKAGFMRRLADKGGGIPYGIALAIGGLLVYPQSRVWLSLSGYAS